MHVMRDGTPSQSADGRETHVPCVDGHITSGTRSDRSAVLHLGRLSSSATCQVSAWYGCSAVHVPKATCTVDAMGDSTAAR